MSAQRLAIFLQHYEPETYHRIKASCIVPNQQSMSIFRVFESFVPLC